MELVRKNTINPLKRIAAVHDLSCFGRCALTVVIPALSAMGHQVVPLPTALLSTHTGGFTDMYFKDLTHAMGEISDHFTSLSLDFDAIYTGFLGNEAQIDSVLNFIKDHSKEDTLVLIDPVMGDDGELYSTYTRELKERMKELCTVADIITPNITEACFLCGEDYIDTSKMSEKEAEEVAGTLGEKLKRFNSKYVIITGIPHLDNALGTYVCGKDSSGYFYNVGKISKSYPGTGDLFASVLLGCLLNGREVDYAVKFASDYICKVMNYSSTYPTPEREGVAFEHFMLELAQEGQK